MTFASPFQSPFVKPFPSEAVATPSQLFYDQFIGTNGTNLTAHTPDVGNAWAAAFGTMTIQSNAAYATSGAYYVADMGQANMVITARLQLDSGNSVGVIARYTDLSNYWFFYARTGLAILYERTSGSSINRASGDPACSTSTWYDVVFTLNGSSISATLNGLTLNYTSSQHASNTKAGLIINVAATPVDTLTVVAP